MISILNDELASIECRLWVVEERLPVLILLDFESLRSV